MDEKTATNELQKLSKNDLIAEVIKLRTQLQIYEEKIRQYDPTFNIDDTLNSSAEVIEFLHLTPNALNASNIEFYGNKLLIEYSYSWEMIPKVDMILNELAKNNKMSIYKSINQKVYSLNTPTLDDLNNITNILSILQPNAAINNNEFKTIVNNNTISECLAYLRTTNKTEHINLTNLIYTFLDGLVFNNPLEINNDKKLIACKLFVQLSEDRMNRMNLNITRKDWNIIHQKGIQSLKTLAKQLDFVYNGLSLTNDEFKILIDIKNLTLIDRQDDMKINPIDWYVAPYEKVNEDKYIAHIQKLNITKSYQLYGWQAYMDFLVKIGEKINRNFLSAVCNIVGKEHFIGCKIKSQTRMMNKMSEYKNEGKRTPYLAHLLDIVRCCCYYGTPSELVQGLEQIKKNFDIVRLKNTFYKDAVIEYGYRAVYCNVLYQYKGTKMICEIQLTLTKFKQIAKKMHLYYKIVRANSAREVGYDMS